MIIITIITITTISIVLLKNSGARDLYLEIVDPANLTAWKGAIETQIAKSGN